MFTTTFEATTTASGYTIHHCFCALQRTYHHKQPGTASPPVLQPLLRDPLDTGFCDVACDTLCDKGDSTLGPPLPRRISVCCAYLALFKLSFCSLFQNPSQTKTPKCRTTLHSHGPRQGPLAKTRNFAPRCCEPFSFDTDCE